ncbi:MAG TPA: KH domain-containing protein [Limnochordia bacterium]
MQHLVELIARALVDHPDEVRVQRIEGERAIILELRVAPEDVGQVIGRQGRVARAIRAVVKAAGQREGKAVHVEILD